MSSELVTGALKYVPNRYLLTRLAATAVRAFHRPDTRIAETANQVWFRFSLNNPMARGQESSSDNDRIAPCELRYATTGD